MTADEYARAVKRVAGARPAQLGLSEERVREIVREEISGAERRARAFLATCADDSQNEPPDFEVNDGFDV